MKGHSEHNSSEKEQQNQEIPGMNLDNKYKAKMPSVEASQEIQKEMDKTRKELEKLKSFIIKKYPFTQALSILPAPAMKFFIEEEEVPKEAEKYIQLYDIRDKEEYKNFKKFYELSTNFLDSVYDGCYLLCIYFREEEYPEPQQILGKNCRYGGEDIYERRVDRYSCSSLQGLYKGEVKYAELISLSSNGKPIKIKLFSGDIGQVH